MKGFNAQFPLIIFLLLFCFLTPFSAQAQSLLAAKHIQLKSVKANAKFINTSQIEILLKSHKSSVVNLLPKNKAWDLSQYHGLNIELENTSGHRITPAIKLTAANSNQWQFVDSSVYLEPGESKNLMVHFLITADDLKKRYPQFKKMNAGPSSLMSSWKGIDLTKVNQMSFTLLNEKGHSYQNSLTNVSFNIKSITPYTLEQLFDYPKNPDFPFVDKFGQYLQAKYPEKLQDTEQWQAREQQELADLNANISPEHRSKWGGWLKGPKQKATGYFYTTQIDGKWWFVDPEGYLFWSHGVTGVGHKGANTSIQGRTHYFKDLPSKWGEYSDFHVGGRFDFTQANLYRKYGKNWQEIAIKRNHQRLKSWGMNTYGNWSQPENSGEDKTPFTVAVHYKSNMLEEKFPDPWDKNFANRIKQSLIEKKRDEQADSPWNIGFFVDNELHFKHAGYFSEIITSAAKDQPAKIVFVDYLKNKYKDIDQLNIAWKAKFSSFNQLLKNREALTQHQIGKDGDWFYQQMVERYYRLCRDSVKGIFPNHLYLGSRVHGDTHEVVLRAAEKYADVISYNIYHRNLTGFTSRAKNLTKPLMATEFHFGALDRGVFHTGLQGVSNQKERAQHYYEYVKSALNNPLFIGTHWFQYRAQAITGRGDGENYQIGLVDITDTPYPETIEAVRKVGYQLYETRWTNKE